MEIVLDALSREVEQLTRAITNSWNHLSGSHGLERTNESKRLFKLLSMLSVSIEAKMASQIDVSMREVFSEFILCLLDILKNYRDSYARPAFSLALTLLKCHKNGVFFFSQSQEEALRYLSTIIAKDFFIDDGCILIYALRILLLSKGADKNLIISSFEMKGRLLIVNHEMFELFLIDLIALRDDEVWTKMEHIWYQHMNFVRVEIPNLFEELMISSASSMIEIAPLLAASFPGFSSTICSPQLPSDWFCLFKNLSLLSISLVEKHVFESELFYTCRAMLTSMDPSAHNRLYAFAVTLFVSFLDNLKLLGNASIEMITHLILSSLHTIFSPKTTFPLPLQLKISRHFDTVSRSIRMLLQSGIPESIILHEFLLLSHLIFKKSLKIYADPQQKLSSMILKLWGKMFLLVIDTFSSQFFSQVILSDPDAFSVALQTLSLLEFVRVKSEAFKSLFVAMVRKGAKEGSFARSFVTFSLPDATSIGASRDKVFHSSWNKTIPSVSRNSLLLACLQHFLVHLSPLCMEQRIIPFTIENLYSNRSTSGRAHLLYALCLKKDQAVTLKSIPFVVCRSLEEYPLLVPFKSFAPLLSEVIRRFPGSNQLGIFTIHEMTQKCTTLLALNKTPTKLSVLLMHALQWVEASLVPEVLTYIRHIFVKANHDQRLELASLMYTVITNNFDITRKEHCINWFISLLGEYGINQDIETYLSRRPDAIVVSLRPSL